VVKECYEEVWNTLAAHKDALWAGVAALAEHSEMLGAELRDVFDKHPPTVSDDNDDDGGVPSGQTSFCHLWCACGSMKYC
jgi:hypothetical protein